MKVQQHMSMEVHLNISEEVLQPVQLKLQLNCKITLVSEFLIS